MSGQLQHTEYHRKIALRKNLLEKAGKLRGAFYIPFIGDGDIAVDLYRPRGNKIYGVDIDPERTRVAQPRLPEAEVVSADCDTFPFRGRDIEYSLADFDSYAYPYEAFRAFWKEARVKSPCVLFFTDGQRQAISRTGYWKAPDGTKRCEESLRAKREQAGLYYPKVLLPWFEEFIKPWRIKETAKYLRGQQVYWGVIIENPDKQVEQGKPVAAAAPPPQLALDGERRKKFDKIRQEAYLLAIRQGKGRCQAAREVAISPGAVSEYSRRDLQFAAEVTLAEIEITEKVENSLFEAAISGNVTAIQVWLYNRAPARWADKRNVQVAGQGGGPIYLRRDVKEMSDSDLEAAIGEAQRIINKTARGTSGADN